MNIESVVTGGGTGSLVVALAYAYQQFQAARRDRRAELKGTSSSAVTDAAAVNSMLLATLEDEREEVQRLSGRVQELENQNALLYERIRDQRREYEHRIDELRAQVDSFREQLDALREQLRTGEM